MTDEDDVAIAFDVLPRGTPVVDREGVDIGSVHEVLNNAREHIFDGIIVATKDGRRFVDAPEVARMTARRVTLTITAAEVAELPVRSGRGSVGGALRRLLGR